MIRNKDGDVLRAPPGVVFVADDKYANLTTQEIYDLLSQAEQERAEIDAVRVKEQAAGKKLQEERDWYKQQMDRFVNDNGGLNRTVLDLIDLLNRKNAIVAYYDNRD